MSLKRKSEMAEEPTKKIMLDPENFLITRNFPDVIWQQIFTGFSLKEIKLNLAPVCKHFNEISDILVQEIYLDSEEFHNLNRRYKMFDNIPSFI